MKVMVRRSSQFSQSSSPCYSSPTSGANAAPVRFSLATALVLAALLLTITVAWLYFILSSHHHCHNTTTTSTSISSKSFFPKESIPSPFPWQAAGWETGVDSDLDSGSGLGTSAIRHVPTNNNNRTHLHLRNVVFGIAGSARLWPLRKHFLQLWWKPNIMRGFVWLDEPVLEDGTDTTTDNTVDNKNENNEEIISSNGAASLPALMVSESIFNFRYTHPVGSPSGIRIARILLETFRLGLPDVLWFVLCDDDTFFSPHNLLRVLAKYDPTEMYYIGGQSESHLENYIFSYSMAYGGGGVAISYPLAEALVAMLDSCIQRYPHLFGSDDRLHACTTELGIPMTKEPGFHQFDIRGSAFGLLAAHPVAPFISMHHLEVVDPFFPQLGSLDSLRLLGKAMQTESGSFLQQSICYNTKQKLSFSISIGYVVQVFPRIVSARELQKPEKTFRAWNRMEFEAEFDINTRPSAASVCDQPFLFFLEEIHLDEGSNEVVSIYRRHSPVDDRKKASFCWSHMFSPDHVQRIRVVSQPLDRRWFLNPRRQCCTLGSINNYAMDITVLPCQKGMVIS